MMNNEKIMASIEQWLDDVVIGLNLCPFAAKPRKQNQIKFVVSEADTDEQLLADLMHELELLTKTPAEQIETTLLIVKYHLKVFMDYNQFLDAADLLIHQLKLAGIFQIASFHPDYQFADTEPDDRENLTNKAPFPILHILRENSIEKALQNYPNPEQIPQRNIKRMESMSRSELKKLFPFL